MNNKKLYKLIDKDDQSAHGGNFDWTDYLPSGDHPGLPTPTVRNVLMCLRGYHLTDAYHLLDFMSDKLFEAEIIGDAYVADGEKIACESVRLIRQVTAWNVDSISLRLCEMIERYYGYLLDDHMRNVLKKIKGEKYEPFDLSESKLAMEKKKGVYWFSTKEFIVYKSIMFLTNGYPYNAILHLCNGGMNKYTIVLEVNRMFGIES